MRIRNKITEKEAISVHDLIHTKISGLPLWVNLAISGGIIFKWGSQIKVNTLEGTMIAREEDYIIKGIYGEIYPCKPEIFMKSYDILED